MELILHARRFGEVIFKEIEDGPELRAQIKRDDVSWPVVPWASADRDGCVCGAPGWGEVASAGLRGGCFPNTENSVYLRLLE